MNAMRALCLTALAFSATAGKPPPPPPPVVPLQFSSTCGDYMVLQQAPAKAAVVGTLNSTTGGTRRCRCCPSAAPSSHFSA